MLTYNTILVATEFEPLSHLGTRAAESFARRFRAKRVHFVHVVELSAAYMGAVLPYGIPEAAVESALANAIEEAKAALDKIRIDSPGTEITHEIRRGIPAKEISAVADEINADLIVLASHGRSGISRALMGSVSSRVIRMASRPVCIVREEYPATGPFKRILATVDLSAVSTRILENAFAMAVPDRALVHVLSLYEHPLLHVDEATLKPRYFSPTDFEEYERRHRKAVEKLVASIERPPEIEVTIDVMSKAPPANVICEVAELTSPDLIVLGTSGHNTFHRMILGATATKVIVRAPSPVVVVPFGTVT